MLGSTVLISLFILQLLIFFFNEEVLELVLLSEGLNYSMFNLVIKDPLVLLAVLV